MTITDVTTWRENARTTQPKWENRAKIISHFIRPGDRVVDLGAGDEKLRKYLPANCHYTPIDCVGGSSDTFVVDYNVEFKTPKVFADVVVSAGFIEYIKDIDGFLFQLSKEYRFAYFLMTYSYSPYTVGKPKQYKKINAFQTEGEVIARVSPYVGCLREIARIKNQTLFGGQLGLSEGPQSAETLDKLIPRQSVLKRLRNIIK